MDNKYLLTDSVYNFVQNNVSVHVLTVLQEALFYWYWLSPML